jgi:crossover junction endodeoxyribonuclease RusA
VKEVADPFWLLVCLPWPPKQLSPNARVHWAVKAKVAKSYLLTCWWMTSYAVRHHAVRTDRRTVETWDRIGVAVQFCPPDLRSYDVDNMVARLKSGLDGVADALGVNDEKFQLTPQMGAKVKGGAVYLRITEAT